MSFKVPVCPGSPSAGRPGYYISVRHCGGLSFGPSATERPLGTIREGKGISPDSGFQSHLDMT